MNLTYCWVGKTKNPPNVNKLFLDYIPPVECSLDVAQKRFERNDRLNVSSNPLNFQKHLWLKFFSRHTEDIRYKQI